MRSSITRVPQSFIKNSLRTGINLGLPHFSSQRLAIARCYSHAADASEFKPGNLSTTRWGNTVSPEPSIGSFGGFEAFERLAGMADQQPKLNHGKRPLPQQKSKLGIKRQQKKARKRERDMKNGSSEEVLGIDVQNLIDSLNEAEDGAKTDEEILPEEGSEIEVEVVELSSTGDALALQTGSKRVYVLQFAVPGDIVKVKVYRHLKEGQYTVADFIAVVKPSPSRNDAGIQCQYFSRCAGCQFQMLDYAEQLRLKKRIVEKAFKNFSQLPPELIPAIQDTIGSPLQYGYRTKLTPHFDGPQKTWSKKNKIPFDKVPDIGFMLKGTRKTLDIEDCPIGTDAVRLGMKNERERMNVEYDRYTRGATILLRESTLRIPKDDPASPSNEVEEQPSSSVIRVETDTYVDLKTCVTDNKGTSTEYVGDYIFQNPAGSFFQNNNSILPVVTDYIREAILPPSTGPSSTPTSTTTSTPEIKYLIDAYSGSGLFTITLSSLFQGSTGIDIADDSIKFARTNASSNNLPESQANFIAADARELFKNVRYPADETVVVLDPPRKGCDADFLGQLLRFGPRRVVYVSCNVHTQARDVGALVRGETGGESDQGVDAGAPGTRYEIESLRGFDFFPQTAHVEGVAVLSRVEKTVNGGEA
ncbi:S-adenosyl-L-methionine-dependent methyltransferase [Whalleya microplaca]|nr:S-adenosyl-L-methionine-dependent methyltransferase [Whalleya microplaca]